jgi:hypothetical protein
MHSGFEPSVVRKLGESMADVVTLARWQFEDVRNGARRQPRPRTVRAEAEEAGSLPASAP